MNHPPPASSVEITVITTGVASCVLAYSGIESVIQKGRQAAEAVPLVMMSHEAVERNVRNALAEIDKMDCVAGATVVIRVEEGKQ